ncbi:MAG TPA: hypothetical protein VFP33_09295 [Gallionella sp.]|nr:hypothetical protein [Gallionella sp.]
MTVATDWITAISTFGAAVGVWYARQQLISSRGLAQLQFEDSLAKEYREIANRIPTKALLGSDLSDDEYAKAFDDIFHYIDLSNEQVYLRIRGRIGNDVWENWRDGIKTNLSLPTFRRAWSEIKEKSGSFQELRRLEKEEFKLDPCEWDKTRRDC